MFRTRYIAVVMAGLMLSGAALAAGRANPAAVIIQGKPEEAKLIALIGSDAAPGEKAIACKQLAIYGTPKAVPALATLLTNPELTSWARIALESIPGPAADDALREALPKVQGRMAIGVINSIAVRRDAKAVDLLVQRLKDPDAEVASAAGAALGRIGTDAAGKALEAALPAVPAGVRSAVAEGCVYCAEALIARGNTEDAARFYDLVRKADVPQQRIVEATRGAILARGAAGLPLLVETLHNPDKVLFQVSLRVAREMTLPQVTDLLIAELGKAAPERQGLLLFALADRGDAKALPAIVDAAKSGPTPVRIAAVTVLERLGNASCIPVLLDAAVSDEKELATAAKNTLNRLQGSDVEAELLSRISTSTGKTRQVLMELAGLRRIEGVVGVIMKYVEDADPAVRATALDTIGAIGEDKQVVDLVKLAQKPGDRTDIEKALMAICGRWGVKCVPDLMPLVKSDDSAVRSIGLHTLACAGGADALAAVKSAVQDKEAAVQDEAVRTLSTWPNRWPEDSAVVAPLLDLAKSAANERHKVLALRGYLQYVQGAKTLREPEKMARIDEILPVLTRPEEKRAVVSCLSAIGSGRAVQELVKLTADASVAEDACSAIVQLAGRTNRPIAGPQRQKALQAVIATTKNQNLKNRAQSLLNRAGN